jgi:hypothetical protein
MLILMNSKGISVLFLIIAMLLMITIGYVFSYLIPTKQTSIKFPISSTQAFFLAQSGLEYGIRYCSDQGWRGATDTGRLDHDRLNDAAVNQRNLGNGRFTINYNTATNELTSTGEVSNTTEKRILIVSNFNQFLRLTFNSSPCWIPGYSNQRAQFNIIRWRTTGVTVNAFSATWQEDGAARNITTILMGGTTRFSGTYNNGSGSRNFTGGNQAVPLTSLLVEMRWDSAMTNPRNIVVTFYSTTGDSYIFNLDPAGNNLPGC